MIYMNKDLFLLAKFQHQWSLKQNLTHSRRSINEWMNFYLAFLKPMQMYWPLIRVAHGHKAHPRYDSDRACGNAQYWPGARIWFSTFTSAMTDHSQAGFLAKSHSFNLSFIKIKISNAYLLWFSNIMQMMWDYFINSKFSQKVQQDKPNVFSLDRDQDNNKRNGK